MTDGTTQSQRNNEMKTGYVLFLRSFEFDQQLYPKENIFFFFVLPKRFLVCGRTAASMKICRCRQVFVPVETSTWRGQLLTGI